MKSSGKPSRRKKGVGSIIGAVFLVLIILSGFTFYQLYLNIADHYNGTLQSMGESDWSRNRERIVIKNVEITGSGNLNVTVENDGTLQSHLIWFGIFNVSALPETQAYYSLDISVDPAETKSVVSVFAVAQGSKYAVQLVTELGNTIGFKFYPASQVRCQLTLTTAPPTAYKGNNVTVALTVTHNDSEVDAIQSLTVSLSPTPSGLVQLMDNSSLTVRGLRKGESAFFWWIYSTVGTGTAIFNATYGQAPVGVYAITSLTVLDSPGEGGAGTVWITGVNGTGFYNPSWWNLLGSTQYVSGSVSDLASNDSSYAVFRSYYSGSTTDTNDAVDNNSSNVDGLGNKGAHSNFTAMQYGPDSIYDTLTETGSGTATAYYPSNYGLFGSTQLVSGSLANLQADDGVYMAFRSYQTSSSGQLLYAHSETATIGGSPYYLQRLTSGDGTGTSLSSSMGAVGRNLFGKFVYPLTGVSSVPASTWTMYYRSWMDSGSSIAFDAVGSGKNEDTGSTQFSWYHATGSSSNRIMIVGISIKLTTVSVMSISYGAQSLTFIRNDTQSTNVRSELWYLIAPASGNTVLTVTLSGGSHAAGGSCTYSGVAQTSPVDVYGGANGNSDSPSSSVAVVTPNSWMVGNLAIQTSSGTVSGEGSGQAFRWDNWTTKQAQGDRVRGHGSDKGPVTVGSQSMSWSLSSSAPWAVSIVVFKPATPSGHVDIDILVRQSGGTIRATMATNVATSGSLTSGATTLSGTYAWAAYTVVSESDYLEVDYYVDVTTAVSGVNAYLRIDDNTLAVNYQTRATNVMLPAEYTVEVEFSGTSDTSSWTQLVWTIDSSFSVAGVTATFQLYNYTAGAYPASGDGYMTDTIGTSDVTKTQTITVNPNHFRDGSGNWRMKVKGVLSTVTQFDWRVDFMKFAPSTVAYELDLEVQWTGVDYSQANEWLCVYGGSMGAESLSVDVWNGSIWNNVFASLSSGWNNVSVSSYLTSSNFTIRFKGTTETGDIIQDSWNVDVALLHLWTVSDQYTAEVEFTGSSNLQTWASLLWQIQSCWDVGQVTVTIQFYNFTFGNYSTSGNGYLGYVSSATPNTNELKSQAEISSPDDFKNATGHWRVRVKGVKSTSTQFLFKVDWVDFETTYSTTGSTVPYNVWQWYTIRATSASGGPIPYAYVSIYANGTLVRFRNVTDKVDIGNPAWVRLDAGGQFMLEVKSASGSGETFVLYAVVGSTVGQKTVTQEAP